MAILLAKALHLISPKRNERILHLFQMLIMHRPGNCSRFGPDLLSCDRKILFLSLSDKT